MSHDLGKCPIRYLMNSSRCILCFENDEQLIQLHECIEHHAHLSCLHIYMKRFRSVLCPFCRQLVSESVSDLLGITVHISDASISSRIDLLKRRLEWPVHDRELKVGLYCIIRKGQIEFLQAMLRFIADTNNLSFDLLSIYKFALINKHNECARVILQKVVDRRIFSDDEDLYSFFRVSFYHGGLELAEHILNSKLEETFRKAFMDNFCNIYRIFVRDKPENKHKFIESWTHEELDYTLLIATEAGDLDCCKFLITKGSSARRANVEHAILKVCVEKKDWDALMYFAELGLDISFDDHFVFCCAIANHKWSLVKFLRTKGANCSRIGLSKSLSHVVRKNDVIGVKTLLDFGAMAGFNKSQILLTALKYGLQSIVNLLKQRGASMEDVKDSLIRPNEELSAIYDSVVKTLFKKNGRSYYVRISFDSTTRNFFSMIFNSWTSFHHCLNSRPFSDHWLNYIVTFTFSRRKQRQCINFWKIFSKLN